MKMGSFSLVVDFFAFLGEFFLIHLVGLGAWARNLNEYNFFLLILKDLKDRNTIHLRAVTSFL